MDDFDLSSFDTFDVQQRRMELANQPVSEELLKARANTERMVKQYNAMNLFLGAMGKRTGAPMSMPTYDDSPSTSDVASADEQAATEFMRSLDKIRQQVGRDLTENERNSLARAYGLGPKGLATLDKYFKYIGKTDADLRAEAGEQRAISAEQRAIAGEERAATTFEQSQQDRTKKETEEYRYGLIVREASNALRKLQDDEGFDGDSFAAQQEIRRRLQKQAELFGLDPTKAVADFDKLIVNAPKTKQVFDNETNKMVFRTDEEIRASGDRYTPLQDNNGKLSTSAEITAISVLDELGIELVDGLKVLQLMDQHGPLGAMQKYPELSEIIQRIASQMGTKQNVWMQFLEKAMGSSIGNTSSDMSFE